ncbi:TonB-dependent receptor [Thermomonas mangrovi]|uniref:TonB-dependent receptor n=1 Tax=Thermomonas mangrovi TaxID=2993316 RepID=UPI002307F8C2|nr:TonB-dependent receptor [Thermomonas mangrovi]
MFDTQPKRRRLALAVVAALATSPALPAMAQDAAQAPAQQEAKTLDKLVVTAQKREEALQDVPVVVTALSEEILKDTGVRDVKDLQVLVPGLTVTSTQSEALTTARIRGIGTVGDNAGLESSVGVVIDGVYRPRNGVGFGDLGELERIEVLKGPQGTLFGKNTSAGVINVVTKRPGFEPSAEVELTGGNYAAMGIAGSLNLPIGDNSAFRIYAAQRARDGYIDVHIGAGPRTETDDFNQDFGTVRAQFRWDPSDTLTLNLAADVTNRTEDCCTGVTIIRGSTASILDALTPMPGDRGVAPIADPYAREAWSNRSTGQHIKDKGLSLQADWTTPWFGGATLTSVTAKRKWSSANGLDFDFSTADLLYRNPTEDDNYSAFDTFSQEFRLTGSTDTVDWLVGAFYSNEDLDRNEAYRVGAAYEPYLSVAILGRINPALAASPTAPLFLSQASGRPFGTVFLGHAAADTYEQNAKSFALFTNNTWHASDALDLTLGLRYTSEDKSLSSRYTNPNGGLGCASMLANPAQVVAALVARGLTVAQASAAAPQVVGFSCLPWTNVRHNGRHTEQDMSEGEWSGTLKAAYRWNDHVMTYASAARGYKGGGFNLDRVQSNTGLSSGVSGIVPVDDTSFPAEFVDSYELGAKTTWLGGNLLLNATLFHQTYSDFQLNSFLGTSFVVRSIPTVTSRGFDAEVLYQNGGLFVQGGLTYAKTKYGDDLLPDADLVLLPGSTASFAPKWSATGSVGYEFDLGKNLVARMHVGAKYMSEYNTGSDLDPQKLQSGYTTVNARASLGGRDGHWAVELWAQNLTDAEYMQVAFDAPLQTGSWNAFLGQPRTYGVTLRWRY